MTGAPVFTSEDLGGGGLELKSVSLPLKLQAVGNTGHNTDDDTASDSDEGHYDCKPSQKPPKFITNRNKVNRNTASTISLASARNTCISQNFGIGNQQQEQNKRYLI